MDGTRSLQSSSLHRWRNWRGIGTLVTWRFSLSRMGRATYGIRSLPLNVRMLASEPNDVLLRVAHGVANRAFSDPPSPSDFAFRFRTPGWKGTQNPSTTLPCPFAWSQCNAFLLSNIS